MGEKYTLPHEDNGVNNKADNDNDEDIENEDKVIGKVKIESRAGRGDRKERN